MNTKKLAAFLAMLLLAFSLTACGGDDAADVDMEDGEEMEEMMDDSSMDGGLSDEEFLDTVRELVGVLEGMEGMSDEESFAALGEIFELAAKLEGFDDARAEVLLNSEPELKAALENLDSMSQ